MHICMFFNYIPYAVPFILHLYLIDFGQRCQGNSAGEKTVFSINGAGTIRKPSYYKQKLKIDYTPKCKDYNNTATRRKLLQEKNLCDVGMSKKLLDIIVKAQRIRENIDKLYFIKLKTYTLQKASSRKKGKPQTRRKHFQNMCLIRALYAEYKMNP